MHTYIYPFSFFLLFFKKIYLFILCWVLVAAHRIFLSTCGIFSCGMRTLSCSMYDGSSSPTRNRTQAPCIGRVESYSLDHQGNPSILFQILFPFRLLKNIEQHSLCYYSMSLLVISFKYSSVYMPIPNSQSSPPPSLSPR